MSEHRNMILAVVISVLILVGFEYFFADRRETPPPQQPTAGAEKSAGAPPTAPAAAGRAEAPPTPGAATAPAAEGARGRDAVIAEGGRARIASPRLHGSILLKGARFDDLTLADYHLAPDPKSPEVVLLSPQGSGRAYFAEFGWVPTDGVAVPGPDTPWTASGDTLSPESPLTLTWDNGTGLRFLRTIALDRDYMFTITDRVENRGDNAAKLFPYGLISRHGTPETTQFWILHEGPVGVFDGTLKEVDYDDLQDAGTLQQTTTNGWLGIKDQYWLTALVPKRGDTVTTRFVHRRDNGNKYQADFLGPPVEVAPGAAAESQNQLFAGAKEVSVLERYGETIGIPQFHMAIDYTKIFFLTIPLHKVLIYFNEILGNYGLAILLLTVIIKLIFFPLANKSYKAMSKMKKLQPEMIKLRDQFGDDKVRLNQEMMALYKREKTNPASGCLPIVIQIPVFFALYVVLFVTIEMRHAPFYGWIHDLSAPDPTTLFNLFGLIPWTPPDFLMIGVWPLIMGATMWLQQKLNPQPADPMQAKIFMFLPILFTFLLAQFPAGLVIYWAWNNLLSIIQQKVIMVRMGVK